MATYPTPTFQSLTLSGGTVSGLPNAAANGQAVPFGQTFGPSGASHAQGLVPDPGATSGTTLYLREDGTWTTAVSSVSLALPPIFTVSGSPITTSGTLTGTLVAQNPSLVFAGPASGAAAAPIFRALVTTDLPASVAILNSTDGLDLRTTQTGASTTPAASVGFGSTETIILQPFLSNGSYNPIVQLNDAGIIYSMRGNGTPADGFSICSWGGSGGLRLDPIGNVTITGTLSTNLGVVSSTIYKSSATATYSLSTTSQNIIPTTGVGTLTVPANAMKIGSVLRCTLRGYVASNPASTSNLFPTIILGSTTIGSTTAGKGFISSNSSGYPFSMEVTLTCTAVGSTGSVVGTFFGAIGGLNNLTSDDFSVVGDSTVGASVALNTTVGNGFQVGLAGSVACNITVVSAFVEFSP